MMKNYRGLTTIAIVLILVSLVIYLIHYLVFNDLKDVLFYTVMDLAFLPIQVLLVGIVLDRILTRREVNEKIHKLNMVVGTFFSEVGRDLASLLLSSTDQKMKIIEALDVTNKWNETEFAKAQALATKDQDIRFDRIDLKTLKSFLSGRRSFLLVLMENPNLLEHERFTDLLLAAFHLTEELDTRPSMENLPPQDVAHIQIDIERVYRALVIEWLDYMRHVKVSYPFLYSHYLRVHPFQLHPSAIVQ
jgi:hypothetical protein